MRLVGVYIGGSQGLSRTRAIRYCGNLAHRIACFALVGFVAASSSAGAQTIWASPELLSIDGAFNSGADVTPRLATDGLGNWVAVWESTDDLGGTIGAEGDILVATSANNGSTWTAPDALNTDAATDVALDYAPEVTTDGAGNWVAA